MPKCRRKVSPALLVLPLIHCISPASVFRINVIPEPLVTDYSGSYDTV
jgi:hypothetical protein